MHSNTKSLQIKFNKTKLVIFLTLFIYIFNIFMPLSTVFGENINVADINIYSKAAILVDTDTGDILYSKNGDSKVYPASTTKILTAILAIEKLDLDATVVVSQTAVDIPYGSSNVALKAGEVISIKDLLYCLMLHSGNDSANVLAEAVSGTIPQFISLMNSKVKELSLTGTNFTSAHGFHDDNHYTTPSDMMKIFEYAIKNETFRTICSTKEYTVQATNKTPEKRVLQNTNRLILTKSDSYLSSYYEYCLGGKTGFTDEAGRTFVSFGKKGDRNVVLGTFDVMDIGSKDGRYLDAITLFEYGFNNFTKKTALKKDDFKFEYIDKNNGYKYILGTKDDVYFSVKNVNSEAISNSSISTTHSIDQNLLNNTTNNTTTGTNCQVVGTVTISFNSNSQTLEKQVPLVLLEKSKLGVLGSISTKIVPSFKNIIYILLSILFLIFLSLILIIVRKNTNVSKKLKKKHARKISNNKLDHYAQHSRRKRF